MIFWYNVLLRCLSLGCPHIFDLGLYFTAAAREPNRLPAFLVYLYIAIVRVLRPCRHAQFAAYCACFVCFTEQINLFIHSFIHCAGVPAVVNELVIYCADY